jgi:two-component system sensor histidine kinase UhpB
VQRIVRELRPEALDDLGLGTALEVLGDRVSEQTGLPVASTLDPDLPELSPEQELVVYRVAQESLTNVVKHSDASQAEVRLARTATGTVLSVRDDGRGLDGRVHAGRGIRGMRERALLIGADLSVESRPEGGVEVRLAIRVGESS